MSGLGRKNQAPPPSCSQIVAPNDDETTSLRAWAGVGFGGKISNFYGLFNYYVCNEGVKSKIPQA